MLIAVKIVPDLGLKCLKRYLIEANCHAILNCSKQLLNDVIFIRFNNNKKAQLSLTNPRDACEKFARFT